MENYLKEIEAIKAQIKEYNEMAFDNENEDYNFNKSVKNKLKLLILNLKNNNENMIEAALLVLAESTGCAEDQEIAEDIVSYLYDHKHINKNQMDYFYENIGTNRWM
jgi:hypothetical protein